MYKKEKPNFIYVLRLEKGKYYIGKTKNVERRFKEHCKGYKKGSEWTTLYKPLKIEKEVRENNRFHELTETYEWMEKKGILNVRGAKYCTLKLNEIQINEIEDNLKSSKDQCYNCGSKDHLISKCTNKKKSEKSISKPSTSLKNEEFQKNRCYRCGRLGHWMNTCFAKSDVNGFLLNDSSSESSEDMESEEEEEKPKVKCYRCGRLGHYANKCYSKTHMKGFIISKN